MTLPVIPSVGVQLGDLSSYPQYSADAQEDGTNASGAGPPSHGRHGPAVNVNATNNGDSTSFDTDTGSYAGAVGGVAAGVKTGAGATGGHHPVTKHPNPAQLAFAKQHQPRGLWARLKAACMPPQPVVAAAAAPDGEASMYLPPTSADVARYWAAATWSGLKAARKWAFDPPKEAMSGHGVLYSLVSRQLPLDLPAYEAYGQELLDREAEGRAAPRRSIFLLPMLHPHCGAAMGWAAAMLCFDLVYTAFWVPVNTAFCLEQYGDMDASCTQVDLAGGIIYIVNLLLGFQVGLTLAAGYRSRVVTDGRDTAGLYVRTWTFWVDLLAIAPFIYLLVLIRMDDSVPSNQTVSIISLMRLVRLFRVASIISTFYTHSVGNELQPSWLADNVSITSVYMVLLCYVCTLFVNLYACILLLIAHYESAAGKTSWMDSVSWMNVTYSNGARQWWSAIYFVITVMTTTGFADFVPKSPIEQVVVNIVMINGLLVFGAVVALIGNTIKRSQAEAQRVFDARKKLSHIRQWMAEGHVPEGTQRDVLTFFTELGAKQTGGRTEGDIVFELPAHLRQKVTRHVLLGLLVQCPQLQGLPAEVRELIASHCVPIELPTGHELFRLGDDVGGAGVWLLEEGVVLATRGQERAEAPSGPTGLLVPCLLGEAAALADLVPGCGTRMWSLRTERPCRLWQLRGPALRAVQRLYPGALGSALLAHVRSRLLGWLAGNEAEEEDEVGWCELVQLLKRSFLLGPLRERIHDCYLALQLAAVEDGSLARLLGAWLEASANRELVAGPDEAEPEDRTSQRFSLDIARATRGIDRTSRLLPGLAVPHPTHAPPGRGTSTSGDLPTPAATPLSVFSPPTSGAVPTAGAGAAASFFTGAGTVFAHLGGSQYSAIAYGGSGYGSVDGGGGGGGGGGGVASVADGGAGGGGSWVAVAAAEDEEPIEPTLQTAEATAATAATVATAAAGGGGGRRTPPPASVPAARRLAHQISLRGVAGAPAMSIGLLGASAVPQLPPVIERNSEFPRSSSATGLQQLEQQQLQPHLRPAGSGGLARNGSGELLLPAPPLSRAASGRFSLSGLGSVGPGPGPAREEAGDGAVPAPALEPIAAAMPLMLTAGQQAMMQLRAPGRARSSRFLSESGSVPYSFYRVASARASVNPSASGHGRTAGLEAVAAAAAAAGRGGSAGQTGGSPGGSLRRGTAAAAALAAAAGSSSSMARFSRVSSTSGRPGFVNPLPALPERASAPTGPVAQALAAVRTAAAVTSPPVQSGSSARTTPSKAPLPTAGTAAAAAATAAAAAAAGDLRISGVVEARLGLPEPPGFGVAGGYTPAAIAAAGSSGAGIRSGVLSDGLLEEPEEQQAADLGRLLAANLSGGARGAARGGGSSGGGADGGGGGGGSGLLTPPPSPPRERDLVDGGGAAAGAAGGRVVAGELRQRRVTDSGGVHAAAAAGGGGGPRPSLDKTSLAPHQPLRRSDNGGAGGGADAVWDALPPPPLLLARRGGGPATGQALAQPLPLAPNAHAPPHHAHGTDVGPGGPGTAAPPPPGRGPRRLSSGGHTSFINKIFLAAGVPLPPPPPPPPPPPAAAAAGLVIAGPACTSCGAATCAFCLRPIVPAGALAAMKPVEVSEATVAAAAASVSAAVPSLPSGLNVPSGLDNAPGGSAGGAAVSAPGGAAISGPGASSLGIKLLGERPLPPVPGLALPRGGSNPPGAGAGLMSPGGSGQLRGGGGSGGGGAGPSGLAPVPPAPAALALARMRSLQPQRGAFAGIGRGGGGGSGGGSAALSPARSMRIGSAASGTAPRLTLTVPHAGSSGGGGGEPSPQPLTPGAALAAAAAAISDTAPAAEVATEGEAAGGDAAEAPHAVVDSAGGAAGGAPGGGAMARVESRRLGGTMDLI